jgi:excisionase family DNA binding protein
MNMPRFALFRDGSRHFMQFGSSVMRVRQANSAKRLLRLKPAADYLSISPATLRGIIQRGELPIIKLTEAGHSPWLIDRVELDSWIERSKITLS